MGSTQKLERYLQAEMERLRSTRPMVPETGAARPFVTLSRQAGAGAISVARVMVDAFDGEDDRNLFSDWQVFDHNLANVVRTEPSIARSLDSLLNEEYRSPTADFFHQLVRSTSDQDRTLVRVFQAVRSLAMVGKTIIIGRAGSRVTADLPLGLHLRLVASETTRLAGIMESDGLDARQAKSELRKVDARRARLLKVHFNVDVDDPAGYDAVWNLDSTSHNEIAEATIAVISRRCRERAGS